MAEKTIVVHGLLEDGERVYYCDSEADGGKYYVFVNLNEPFHRYPSADRPRKKARGKGCNAFHRFDDGSLGVYKI